MVRSLTDMEITNYIKMAKKMRNKEREKMYNQLPAFYERQPMAKRTGRKRKKKEDEDIEVIDEIDTVLIPKPPKKVSVDLYGNPIHRNPITGEVKKVEPKKAPHHTLEDLKKIKALKDEIEVLKTRITQKDIRIKNLKRKVEKLKDIIENPEKEEKRQLQILVENPDFLEIT